MVFFNSVKEAAKSAFSASDQADVSMAASFSFVLSTQSFRSDGVRGQIHPARAPRETGWASGRHARGWMRPGVKVVLSFDFA
jgi:hypothetical protein